MNIHSNSYGSGGSDADALGYDASGLKLGLACAVGDGRWADQHRRPNMTTWRCANQRWVTR